MSEIYSVNLECAAERVFEHLVNEPLRSLWMTSFDEFQFQGAKGPSRGALFCASPNAADASGDWEGTVTSLESPHRYSIDLSHRGGREQIEFHVTENGDGKSNLVVRIEPGNLAWRQRAIWMVRRVTRSIQWTEQLQRLKILAEASQKQHMMRTATQSNH